MIQEDQLRRKIADVGASNDFVAVLAGVPPSTLSTALRGVKALTADRFIAVDTTLNDMLALQAIYAIPIAWRNPQAIQEKIDEMKRAAHIAAQQAAQEQDRVEMDLITRITMGEDPVVIAKRLGISFEEISSRLTGAMQRLNNLSLSQTSL